MEEGVVERDYNTLAILAIIFTFIFPIAGLILGIIALGQIKKTGERGKGLAIASVVIVGIFLFFIAIGIVWVVVRNAFESSYGDTSDIASKCLNNKVSATQASCANGAVNKICDVTLVRTGTGSDEIAGVKLMFKSTTVGVVNLVDVSGNIETVAGRVLIAQDTGIPNAEFLNSIQTAVYFKDEAGVNKLCAMNNPFDF